MTNRNPHTGSSFDDFLKEEGIGADRVAESRRYRSFLDEAARADVARQESGVGYTMPEVHKYVAAKVRGKRAKRPRPVKLRK